VLFRVRCGRLACAIPRPGRGSLNDLTSCKVVERVSHALAAKSAIAPIPSTLFPARKHAINGPGVSYDAPRIVYVCVGLSSGECSAQCQSGNYRIPPVRASCLEATPLGRRRHRPNGRQTRPLWRAPVSCEGQHDRLGPFRSENSLQRQDAANQRMPTGKAILASMETHSERLPSERKSLAVASEVSTLFTDSISASLTDSRVG
jgi:hypothetical protein